MIELKIGDTEMLARMRHAPPANNPAQGFSTVVLPESDLVHLLALYDKFVDAEAEQSQLLSLLKTDDEFASKWFGDVYPPLASASAGPVVATLESDGYDLVKAAALDAAARIMVPYVAQPSDSVGASALVVLAAAQMFEEYLRGENEQITKRSVA